MGLPSKDYALPEGVRISIHDTRPYQVGANKLIEGSAGGNARLKVVDRLLDANPGGQVNKPGHTDVEIVANTVAEAYELLNKVDEVLALDVVKHHPIQARFRDLWGEFWGDILTAYRQWRESRATWRRKLLKAYKKYANALAVYDREHRDPRPVLKDLVRDLDEVIALMPKS